jgi:hypothetical protein
MFKRAKERIVLWPVSFDVATDEGVVRAQLKARFRLWTATRVEQDAIEHAETQAGLLRSLMAQTQAKIPSELTASAEQSLELGQVARRRAAQMREEVLAAVVGWEDVMDESEQPLAFSREELASLLDQYPNALEGFIHALRTASKPNGALEKN